MGCRVKSSDLLIGAGGPAMVLHCSDACHSAKVSDDRPRWLAIDGLRLMVCGPSTLADGARPGAWTHGSYLCGPHAWETLGGARRSVAKAISSLTNAGDAYAYTRTRRVDAGGWDLHRFITCRLSRTCLLCVCIAHTYVRRVPGCLQAGGQGSAGRAGWNAINTNGRRS